MESFGDIQALPEDCIANALSLTTPKDACRLSLVASTFRSASQSDTVWERFLPSDYRDIIARSVDGPDAFLAKFRSKKELYLYLCDHPILIDGGTKSFSLEKRKGRKCFMLAARELFIVWGDTPLYWQWISLPESRFSEVAELIDVCWLEIRGKMSMKMLSPSTNYAAYLVFTSRSNMQGFNYQPAEASVETSGHEGEKRKICLDPNEERRRQYQIVPRRMGRWFAHLRIPQENSSAESKPEYPKQRDDGWMEVELGECFVVGGEDEGDMNISLLETKGGNWKSGIIIQGIEIRPKKCE